MLGQLFSYAATCVAGDAVDGITRRALWGGLAAVLLLTCFILVVLISFWVFEPQYGPIPVAAVIAASCSVAALIFLSVPALIEWAKRPRERRTTQDPIAQAVSAVEEETEAAVDYFGAIQVVASAFMFGLGAARQLRRR